MSEPNESIDSFVSYCQKSMTSDRPWLLGVCSGIANRFSFDPGIVRAIGIVLGVLSIEVTVIVYVVLWLFFFRGND